MNHLINLRKLRSQKKITMKALGVHLGVTESTVSFYESGKREPSIDTLIKLANYFEISLDELISGEKKPTVFDSTLIPLSEEEGVVMKQYQQLDIEDKAEIRGEIKGMLRHEKYTLQSSERRA